MIEVIKVAGGTRVVIAIPEERDAFEVLARVFSLEPPIPVSAAEQSRRDVAFARIMRERETAPAFNASTRSKGAGATSKTVSVRSTSLDAYRALAASGKLSTQQKLIGDFLLSHPLRAFTRQELARDMNLGINVIAGRIRELLDDAVVVEISERKECSVTRNMVTAVRLAGIP